MGTNDTEERRTPKPMPARPAEDGSQGAPKPTPARDLATADVREAHAPPPSTRPWAPETPADVPEVVLAIGGVTWTVRVLGRSGRAGDRSPPLVLLGFWEGSAEGREHDREATLVARTLAEIPPGRLAEELERADPPRPADRRKPFFEGAGQARRGGSAPRDG